MTGELGGRIFNNRGSHLGLLPSFDLFRGPDYTVGLTRHCHVRERPRATRPVGTVAGGQSSLAAPVVGWMLRPPRQLVVLGTVAGGQSGFHQYS